MDTPKNPEKNELTDVIQSYIDKYTDLYNLIKINGMRWLTVSPPRSDDEPESHLSDWLEEFERFIPLCHNVLIVAEFASLRLHFHIVYDVKDKIKEYKTFNRWAKMVQCRVYNGEPKGGLPYMFKDIEEALLLLKKPDYTITDIRSLKTDRKKNIRIQRQLRLEEVEKVKNFVPVSTPSWFTRDEGEDSDSIENTIFR